MTTATDAKYARLPAAPASRGGERRWKRLLSSGAVTCCGCVCGDDLASRRTIKALTCQDLRVAAGLRCVVINDEEISDWYATLVAAVYIFAHYFVTFKKQRIKD